MFISLENLFSAWDEFKKDKRNKSDVMEFERHLENNLFKLFEDLSKKIYFHQPYETFHIYDPKFRVINKATVRDRVIHHLVFKYLEKIFEPHFIFHSYSCRKGKGTHLAVQNLNRALRAATKNYTKPVWALKVDIKKFFDSIDQEVLLQLLKRRVKNQEMFWLLEKIVRSFSSPLGRGKGVPIGNLTSQIFASIYLSELDYFAKFILKERYYFRYADDFIFLSEGREHLLELCARIKIFLGDELRLTVHPQKISIRKFRQGIDFLGYVLLPHHAALRTKTKRRMFEKMAQKVEEYNEGLISEYNLNQSTQSYLGMIRHCKGYHLSQKLCNEIWENKLGKVADL
ncbi:MAG: reverse transcriptase domain-containing protein [Patescibacteria group bacterium]